MSSFLPRFAAICIAASLPAQAVALPECGGNFSQFVSSMKEEAVRLGHDPALVESFFAEADFSERTLAADRRQGIFQLDFIRFAERLISADRLRRGAQMTSNHEMVFAEIESSFGVPRGILLAFWAFETDYGAFQGDFNTLDSLATLSHDCRRPELFQPQLLAALELTRRGDFDPARTTGAWAGEIGQVQMLPADILEHGRDGDGDGHVDLQGSAADALHSGASMLRGLGWEPNAPWLREVTVPASLDWSLSGVERPRLVSEWQAMGVAARDGTLTGSDHQAALLLPMGHRGPAFLAYPNFSVLFEWNQSFTYVTTVAYFATRLEGAPVFDRRAPESGLEGEAMKSLQRKLAARGYDVGEVDGILGAKTRAAVRAVQIELGLPADSWPTPDLLARL